MNEPEVKIGFRSHKLTFYHEQHAPPNFFSKSWAEIVIRKYQITSPLGGLINMGNSCFMNTVLECLAYSPGLAYFAEHIPNVIYEQNLGRPLFLHHFGVLCRELKFQKQIYPNIFFEYLPKIATDMVVGCQQDAHEFLFALLNRFDEECANSFGDQHGIFETPIRLLFGGITSERRTCSNCHHNFEQISRFLDLTVTVDKPDVFESIAATLATRESDAQCTCDSCGERGTMISEAVFHELPYVLIITLMRFNAFGKKIEKGIDFDFTLDLSPLCLPGKPAIYELFALINHNGHEIHHGHFLNYVKLVDGTWFSVDDGRVVKITPHTVLMSKPYILFYRRSDISRPRKAVCRFGIPPDKVPPL